MHKSRSRSEQPASSQLSPLFFDKLVTVPGDLMQNFPALARANDNRFARSRQIKPKIAFHRAAVRVVSARKRKKPARDRFHPAVRSHLEEVKIDRVGSF